MTPETVEERIERLVLMGSSDAVAEVIRTWDTPQILQLLEDMQEFCERAGLAMAIIGMPEEDRERRVRKISRVFADWHTVCAEVLAQKGMANA